jgi:exonuclease VII small subunit
MSAAGVQVHSRAELWRAYREAFQEFARRVEELESQKTTGHMDRISVDRALLELERALVHYRQCRDALASALLSGRSSRFGEVQSLTRPPDDNQRVEEIAQSLWEFQARREGLADDEMMTASPRG